MAQFDFYGTWIDSWKLLEILTEKNLSLIPDQWYKSPSAIFFNEINEELKDLLHKKRRLFIWGKEFSLFPPHFVLQKSGPRQGEYSIGAAYGGPCLDLTLPACFENDKKIKLSCGTLTFPKDYKNPKTNEWLKTSEDLKKYYKIISTDFKKILKKTKFRKLIWIGGDALNLLENGNAEIVDKVLEIGF